MSRNLEESTLLKFENTELHVAGSRYLLIRLLSEKREVWSNERVAVFSAQRLPDLLSAVVKMYIQLNPRLLPAPENPVHVISNNKRTFGVEVQALKECFPACEERTPQLIGSSDDTQSREWEYPGGYLHLIAMSQHPGLPVDQIYDLSESEALNIKKELISILKGMQSAGWEYSTGDAAKVNYDRPSKKVYLAGFARAEKEDPRDIGPITEKNTVIWQFGLNIWRF
ncbi:hypothetical protein BO71DRAFT_364745 [Aspergillus ellipticus CBS 707.79]|uniref:Uncharacterized protein n=1 Tax=Aspergillus ellipticus CBS 707.79 TaxID=1448320 RepID=A0A319CU68_9EURO|nr:hypothetical protein BO71DRAFT_364745 [Aspergillus ellipticus CBS 707.79]